MTTTRADTRADTAGLRRPNLPGQDAIVYRLGSRASFLAAMREALGAQPALGGITTREPDDPVLALLDAWAGVLDVLNFYDERLANEGFLRTATERGSVLELARAIGYELGPGVAATTWLGFEVVAAPGGLDTFTIPAGTGVQSVPGPNELPQAFETVEAVETKPAWNAIPVVCDAPRAPQPGEAELRLAGTDLVLQQGDPILVLRPDGGPGGGAWFDLRRVRAAAVVQAVLASPTDPEPLVAAHTVVTLDAPLVANSATPNPAAGLAAAEVHVLRQRAALFGFQAQPWDALPVSLRVGELNPNFGETQTPQRGPLAIASIGSGGGISATTGIDTVLRVQEPRVLPGAYRDRRTSWADAAFAAGTSTVDLDQVYPKIVRDSWVAFERAGALAVRRLSAVAEMPRTDFGLSARVSRINFAAGDLAGFSPRGTNVLGQSERLTLARWALPEEVAETDTLDLARAVPALPPGRSIAVTGLDLAGHAVGEIAALRLTGAGTGAGPQLTLEKRLTGRYRRTSLRVLANLAKATHGQSRAEILGSGDHRLAFQSFTLRQAPLTYVSAASATGTRTTLAIWVAGIRWTEVPTLYGQRSDARVYTVRRAEDGAVTVTFGDGRTGARLPSGQDNLVATYRVGVGRAAVLPAGRLTIPLQRPLGLMNVVNPVPADGADDPEPITAARANAPMAVRTLGRIVSLADYEDFAAAFAGVGKARADVLWDGERRIVHLTVTGPAGEAVAEGSAVRADLVAAIDAVRHPTVPVLVASYHPRRFAVDARLVVAADRRPEDVVAAAIAALLARYGFESRNLALPVAAAEVVALLQGTPGVVGVLLDALHDAEDEVPTRQPVILAFPARRLGSLTLPADLVTVAAERIHLVGATAPEAMP